MGTILAATDKLVVALVVDVQSISEVDLNEILRYKFLSSCQSIPFNLECPEVFWLVLQNIFASVNIHSALFAALPAYHLHQNHLYHNLYNNLGQPNLAALLATQQQLHHPIAIWRHGDCQVA